MGREGDRDGDVPEVLQHSAPEKEEGDVEEEEERELEGRRGGLDS